MEFITVEDLINWLNNNAGQRAGVMARDGVIGVFDDESQEVIGDINVETYLSNTILNKVLNTDVSNVTINSEEFSIEEFPNRELIQETTEKRLMQIILARKTLVEKSGYLGDQIRDGAYMEENDGHSKWQIYKLNNGTDQIAVHWSHIDDDSWTVYFTGDNLEIDYMYYEN
ncbi:protein of unknown function [Tenacibaculum sp. 190130A14a]|uniref:Uncharacterized protein n=1 Tax=Tenacibaculum polynesiense TaxID=3137857 RepID=A0ABM9PC31_9FLAO